MCSVVELILRTPSLHRAGSTASARSGPTCPDHEFRRPCSTAHSSDGLGTTLRHFETITFLSHRRFTNNSPNPVWESTLAVPHSTFVGTQNLATPPKTRISHTNNATVFRVIHIVCRLKVLMRSYRAHHVSRFGHVVGIVFFSTFWEYAGAVRRF